LQRLNLAQLFLAIPLKKFNFEIGCLNTKG
jgi:hypothetical protein